MAPLSIREFRDLVAKPTTLSVPPDVRAKVAAAHDVVLAHAHGDAPVYGLNTALGAKLDTRIAPEDVPAFQRQIIEGRAVAIGPPLPENTGRAVLLARLNSIIQNPDHVGISPNLFEHLLKCFAAGESPPVPRYGSIGAGDLTQAASWCLPLVEGVDLAPKDAMALINHSGVSTALSADALMKAINALAMSKAALVLSYEGYGAGQDILDDALYDLRSLPGVGGSGLQIRQMLEGSSPNAKRPQEALSFRSVVVQDQTVGNALNQAIFIFQDELNGCSDNPVVMGDSMCSTANFQNPALALALEQVSLGFAMLAHASSQRIQRLMTENLTGLPRDLSPVGNGSAGMVPLQKTVASLWAKARDLAQPVAFDPMPVSEAVEDVAPMTQQAALKLSEQCEVLRLLFAAEVFVAAQAIDLRKPKSLGALASWLHPEIRKSVKMLIEDRPLGPDIEVVASILDESLNREKL